MLRKLMAPWRRLDWKGLAARAAALISRHRQKVQAAIGAAGLVLVVLLIHREVYSFITHRRQFSAPEIKTAVAPKWAGSGGVEVFVAGGSSLFDGDLVERVGRAFEACPWIRKVTSVERVFPDQIRVRFEYREPHLAVRRPDGYFVVDSEGVRLPGVYVDAPKSCARPAELTGLASRPPEPGRVWEDPALRAGLEMADFVQANPLLRRLAVREIDVSNFGGRVDARRSEIVFVTARGCAIAWGRAPSNGRYGDLSTEEKLENLREVLAAYPNLNGLRCVKLYFRGTRSVEPRDIHAQRTR